MALDTDVRIARQANMRPILDVARDLSLPADFVELHGPHKAKIRLDANAAWNVNQAIRNLARLDQYKIDFIEQPVVQDPVNGMQEVRNRFRPSRWRAGRGLSCAYVACWARSFGNWQRRAPGGCCC